MNGVKGARLLHSHGHRLGRTVDICGPAHKAEAEAEAVYSTFSRPTGRRRSNVKDSIRKKENQNASNKQCSCLKHNSSRAILAN